MENETGTAMRFSVEGLKNKIAGSIILLLTVTVVFFIVLEPPGSNVSDVVRPIEQNDSIRTVALAEPAVADTSEGDLANLPTIEITSSSEAQAETTVADTSKKIEIAAVASVPEQKSEPAPAPVVEKKEAKVVEIRKPKAAEAATPAGWFVQVGAFSVKENAEALSKKLKANGFQSHQFTYKESGGNQTKVMIGPYGSEEHAGKIGKKVEGIDALKINSTLVRHISQSG